MSKFDPRQKTPIPIAKAHILFDLHGVLVSKKELSKQYDQKVVAFLEKQFGISKKDASRAVQEANRKWIRFWDKAKGLPPEAIISNYEHANEVWAQSLVNDRFKGDYRQLAEFLEYTIPSQICCRYPEVLAEIRAFKEQAATLHIASSAHTRHTFGILAGCQLLPYFTTIVGLENTRAVKSDILYYKKMLQLVGAKAEDCLFIGNSTTEISLSKQMGIRSVFITRELTKETIASSAALAKQADLVLPDLANLLLHLRESHLIE
ncbi:MAG: HAD family hydrolase [Candidatus Heimdallarchaeota archaeon]|nr:HAD family hydrolase [Candidatus Heimdallarchaeota archaeon]